MGDAIEVDVAVLGGGIAGLWSLAMLRAKGLGAVLLEAGELGSGQTVASQGIIHGGVKYALGGRASRASEAIAPMPGIWKRSLGLDGQLRAGSEHAYGEVDLREARVLAESCVLWTGAGVGSRLMGLAASKAIRVGPERLEPHERPGVFHGAGRGTDVYRLGEPVVDPRSVLGVLARDHLDAIGGIDASDGLEVEVSGSGARREPDLAIVRTSRRARDGGGDLTIRARLVVAAAGAGNARIAQSLRDPDRLLASDAARAEEKVRMQKRPLAMVMVRGDLPELFGHCVGRASKPIATITTGHDLAGRTVWWIGGQIAEDGVERTDHEHLRTARNGVGSILPWVDLSRTEWAVWRGDRAEGLTEGGRRPDEPVVRRIGPVVFCWPTKLAFAPAVGRRVVELAIEQGVGTCPGQPGLDLERPGVAPLPWDAEGVAWS